MVTRKVNQGLNLPQQYINTHFHPLINTEILAIRFDIDFTYESFPIIKVKVACFLIVSKSWVVDKKILERRPNDE